jgi:hypothetical protein
MFIYFFKFQEFKTLEYIFQDDISSQERLEITGWKQILLSLLPQNILRIFEHLRKWRSLYIRSAISIKVVPEQS